MAGDKNEITNLKERDSAILNRQGWFLVTYYQSREGSDSARAYNLALQKAKSIKRETGLRRYRKGEYTIFEVWEHW